ncbi:MAG TPA: xanthine dehydrogenase family protein molybdopterin-binding subunit, partial [Thermoplasmataceae archaeon]|nr:xanthine dehydrogenase family protein molybdopterin-binding subunit [Thermoplasmataceae archaeon]
MIEFEKRWIGTPVRRVEDRRLITADTEFVDDLDIAGVCYAAFLRSPYAHAKIRRVNLEKARSLSGVIDVIDGQVAATLSEPLPPYAISKFKKEEYCMAKGKVRYEGEIVAAVLADDPAVAEDALELIDVDYEPLEAVVDMEDAMKPGAPLVYDSFGTNVVAHNHAEWGDVEGAFKEADVVIKERIKLQRFSSTPLEPIAVIAKFDKVKGELTLWSNVQMTGHVMMVSSDVLRLPSNKIRLIVKDIGGGFGIKTRPWRQLFVTSILAMRNPGISVKYVEDRREHMLASGMTAGGIFDIEVAAKKDGKILGFKLHDLNNDGASLTYAGTYSSMHATLINGAYTIKNILWDSKTILTNTCYTMPNRGVGKPGIVYVVERMIEFLSQKLNIDPAEIRFRNFIQPDQFPYKTPSGRVYDSGNYPEMLRRALELSEYKKMREFQKRARSEGRLIGIGLATYVHGASATMREIEGINVKIDPRGNIVVRPGSPDMGTSHSTAFCQLLSDILGVAPSDISVDHFDSMNNPWTPYSGTHANKFSGPDVEVTIQAGLKLRAKIIAIASVMLQKSESEINLKDGMAYWTKDPSLRVSLREIAAYAYQNPSLLQKGIEPGLEVTVVGNTPRATQAFVKEGEQEMGEMHQLVTGKGSPTGYMTYPSSAHIVELEVDRETGFIKILKYFIVDDHGVVFNPMIVRGQAIGNAMHGISVALMEDFVYDSNGQLLASTFSDYFKATTMETPPIIDDSI